jgi:hypothetical protein
MKNMPLLSIRLADRGTSSAVLLRTVAALKYLGGVKPRIVRRIFQNVHQAIWSRRSLRRVRQPPV